MRSNTSRHCISCDAVTDHQFLYWKNGCAVLRCPDCGLGSADADDFDPGGYYTRSYFDGGHSDGYADYEGSEPILRREFARQLRFLRQYAPAGGRLLEIGCAYGFFLKEAQTEFEIHGIEIAAEAVNACHRAGLNTVRQCAATAGSMSRLGPLDAIVMLDVIEHLPDPAGILRQCAEQLRPNGVVMITTGDFGSFFARMSGPRWRLMTPPQHLWYFTRTSIVNLADRNGLELVTVRHPWKTVPLALVLFQLARALGFRMQSTEQGRLSRTGVPVNLFDAMSIVLRRPAT